jgi:hypothetical protein
MTVLPDLTVPGWSHFNLFNKYTRDLFVLCILCLCQLYIRIVTHYFFICALLLIIVVHLLCSLFDFYFVLLFDFILHRLFCFIHCSLFKKEKCNPDPELCSGISIPLPVQHHHMSQ